MTTSLSAHLTELLERATEGLDGVTRKRMFGSEGFFVFGKVFALEWDDRLIFKLPDDATSREFAALGGVGWSPTPKSRPMTHWLIAPESFNDDDEATRTWAVKAYQLVKAAQSAGKAARPKQKAPAPPRAKAKKRR